MSRVIRLFLFVALMVLTVTVVSAQKDTTSEAPPTDTIGVIDILEDGDVIESVFEGGVTAHLYAFNGSVGDVITVSMTQSENGELDPFIVITGPSGQVVASDDDSGTEVSLSSLISGAELPEDGSYFLLATSFIYIDNILVEIGESTDTQETGETYTLTISGNTPPTDMEGFDPELISFFGTQLNVGESAEGESTGEFPVSYYVFAGTEGQTVNLTAEGVDGFDTVLHVFSPAGERIAVNDDSEVGVTLDSAIPDLQLPYDGLYLVWATNVFFYNAGDKDAQAEYNGGAFTFSVR